MRLRRRTVERTHSWLNRFGRMPVRWQKLCETCIAMLHLAFDIVTRRATGLLR